QGLNGECCGNCNWMIDSSVNGCRCTIPLPAGVGRGIAMTNPDAWCALWKAKPDADLQSSDLRHSEPAGSEGDQPDAGRGKHGDTVETGDAVFHAFGGEAHPAGPDAVEGAGLRHRHRKDGKAAD